MQAKLKWNTRGYYTVRFSLKPTTYQRFGCYRVPGISQFPAPSSKIFVTHNGTLTIWRAIPSAKLAPATWKSGWPSWWISTWHPKAFEPSPQALLDLGISGDPDKYRWDHPQEHSHPPRPFHWQRSWTELLVALDVVIQSRYPASQPVWHQVIKVNM